LYENPGLERVLKRRKTKLKGKSVLNMSFLKISWQKSSKYRFDIHDFTYIFKPNQPLFSEAFQSLDLIVVPDSMVLTI